MNTAFLVLAGVVVALLFIGWLVRVVSLCSDSAEATVADRDACERALADTVTAKRQADEAVAKCQQILAAVNAAEVELKELADETRRRCGTPFSFNPVGSASVEEAVPIPTAIMAGGLVMCQDPETGLYREMTADEWGRVVPTAPVIPARDMTRDEAEALVRRATVGVWMLPANDGA